MSELRKDIITREWVIVAPERANRVQDFASFFAARNSSNGASSPAPCPFDVGQEHHTPLEIASFRPADTPPNAPGWWVRVVPNKYPALAIEGVLDGLNDGIYDALPGVGAHEVIVETPEHVASLARLSAWQAEEVIWMYRERYRDLQRDSRLQYIMLFRNHRREAGASIAHAHSQLIATPIIPQQVRHEIVGANRYAEYRERCAYCDIVAAELASGERLVAEGTHFVVLEPYASRQPFETWIVPKRHSPDFGAIVEGEVREFATLLRETLLRLEVGLGDPPYNYFVHTRPCRPDSLGDRYHWHLEIVPRLTVAAGFELGAVVYINIVTPERAAQFLREVDLGRPQPEPGPLQEQISLSGAPRPPESAPA